MYEHDQERNLERRGLNVYKIFQQILWRRTYESQMPFDSGYCLANEMPKIVRTRIEARYTNKQFEEYDEYEQILKARLLTKRTFKPVGVSHQITRWFWDPNMVSALIFYDCRPLFRHAQGLLRSKFLHRYWDLPAFECLSKILRSTLIIINGKLLEERQETQEQIDARISKTENKMPEF